MDTSGHLTILFMVLFIIVLLTIIKIDFVVCRDEQQYRCYCSMVFKRKANDFGCLGKGAPECSKCKYYKNFKRHLEEITNDKTE